MVGLSSWLTLRRRRLLVLAPLLALHAATLALALPIILPVRSTASMISSGVNKSFYKDEIGWTELANQTARAWKTLTPDERADAAIVAGNYGEASALEYYGPSRGLPPVLSGHLSWQYWRPRRLPRRFVLFVGYPRQTLTALCRSWTTLATIDNSWHLANEERGRVIAACHLHEPLGAIWNQAVATDALWRIELHTSEDGGTAVQARAARTELPQNPPATATLDSTVRPAVPRPKPSCTCAPG